MSKYTDQLKDIRWVRKRKKIIKRDGGYCTSCGNNKNLIVHHTYYIPLHPPPWAYPDDSLITLCRKCHEKYHMEHNLTINSYHSDRKGRKPFKKTILKKDQPLKVKKKKRTSGGGLSLAELQARRDKGKTRYKPKCALKSPIIIINYK